MIRTLEAPAFAAIFGRPPLAAAEAPGRVNLIGEHTDYNGGLVLPMAIPQKTRCEAAWNRTRRVRVWSSAFPSDRPVEYALGEERAGEGWFDYIQGVTDVLLRYGMELHGFDLRVTGDVPVGSGLSSSASLEIALIRTLRVLFGLQIDDVTAALLGQRVENEFVGAQVGVMDQMAASLADEETALFLDTRTLRHERVPLPAGCEIAIVHSGVAHRIAGGGYAERRQECRQAASVLGVGFLTDIEPPALERLSRDLPEVLYRRVRHVVTENARVRRTVEAMRAGDPAAMGRLFGESHRSMRDDYEVSVPEVNFVVEAASREPGVFGARLTGGGFGGSVAILAEKGRGRAAAEKAADACALRYSVPSVPLVPLA